MTSDGIGPKGPGSGLSTGRGASADIGAEAASVIELTGAIKWFDVSKGYGFIVPDNGMPERSQMYANLMSPARARLRANQTEFVGW